ncbi:hypothetical protein L7F22_007273 [Adiantum nelumboides]|nr:hypothetical protein [Adiantum nelumboides]
MRSHGIIRWDTLDLASLHTCETKPAMQLVAAADGAYDVDEAIIAAFLAALVTDDDATAPIHANSANPAAATGADIQALRNSDRAAPLAPASHNEAAILLAFLEALAKPNAQPDEAMQYPCFLREETLTAPPNAANVAMVASASQACRLLDENPNVPEIKANLEANAGANEEAIIKLFLAAVAESSCLSIFASAEIASQILSTPPSNPLLMQIPEVASQFNSAGHDESAHVEEGTVSTSCPGKLAHSENQSAGPAAFLEEAVEGPLCPAYPALNSCRHPADGNDLEDEMVKQMRVDAYPTDNNATSSLVDIDGAPNPNVAVINNANAATGDQESGDALPPLPALIMVDADPAQMVDANNADVQGAAQIDPATCADEMMQNPTISAFPTHLSSAAPSGQHPNPANATTTTRHYDVFAANNLASNNEVAFVDATNADAANDVPRATAPSVKASQLLAHSLGITTLPIARSCCKVCSRCFHHRSSNSCSAGLSPQQPPSDGSTTVGSTDKQQREDDSTFGETAQSTSAPREGIRNVHNLKDRYVDLYEGNTNQQQNENDSNYKAAASYHDNETTQFFAKSEAGEGIIDVHKLIKG